MSNPEPAKLDPHPRPHSRGIQQSSFWRVRNAFVADRTVLHVPLPKFRAVHTIRAFSGGYNLEVFVDDQVAVTTNHFPTFEQSVCVGVAVGGGTIGSLAVYGLLPAPVTGVLVPAMGVRLIY